MILKHSGVKYRSGRHPYGSGEVPYQHDPGFSWGLADARRKGMSEADYAASRGISTTELRKKISLEKEAQMSANISMAVRLKDKGYSTSAIAERMGTSYGNVAYWLKSSENKKAATTASTAEALKDSLKNNKYLDIGKGTESWMGVSQVKLSTAAQKLVDEEDYVVYNVPVKQVGTGKTTQVKVLCPPGTTWAEVANNKTDIGTVAEYSTDGGLTYKKNGEIKNVSGDRVSIVYGDEGGVEKDGVIELRRGVEDLSLGSNNYAQVRIGVDGTHYLKGMAVYSDDLPDGVDIQFNTNKKSGTDKYDVLKTQEDDPENPFKASYKTNTYTDSDGNEQLSAINIVNEQGTWETWSKTLSSQFLSKQTEELASEQLDEAYKLKLEEYEDIKSVSNPVIRQQLLDEFASECDSDASSLSAAAMPRQSTAVILPVTDLAENEIYAPRYNDGEQVVLIRYPHAGTFEIPALTVNNKSEQGQAMIGEDSIDAVGINSKTAQTLSGADFDGDTVIVIPNNSGKVLSSNVSSSSPLASLQTFDPKEAYPGYEGMHVMTAREKGIHMGSVSNLITDMTIQGATDAEICRAVKHSMVVIDAPKHELNYEQSYIDNGIAQLKEKYQGASNAGASTLISKASSEAHVDETKELYPSQMTSEQYEQYKEGKVITAPTGRTYVNKDGVEKKATTTVTKMDLVDDAYELSSGTKIESIYADYANDLKTLANEARATSRAIETPTVNQSAKDLYKDEVESINSKIKAAVASKPLERQAQIIANQKIKAMYQDHPEIDSDTAKKQKAKYLDQARTQTGAHRANIVLTETEWEAVQLGALPASKIKELYANSNKEYIKQKAIPRSSTSITTSQISRIRSLSASGYTVSQIADKVGLSVSSVYNVLN